jgi:small subunit ribosomal protein S18
MMMRSKRPTEIRVKGCFFCENKKEIIDYKDEKQMRRYVDERGKIVDRRKTGLCARHQRIVSGQVKRARHLALLPFVAENIR